VAAHLEPEILIVDEVLAVGDMDFQKKCMGKMGSVAREGRTVLLVSHNIGLMETLCGRGVLLREGAVVSQGSIQQVVADYLANTELSESGDLLHLPRYTGTNVAKLSHVRIFDSEGNAGNDLRMGSGMIIQLGIKTTERIAQPWVGITLRTAMNQQLFHCANREAGYELEPIDHDCVVECKIDTVNLLPGRYVLDLSLADAKNALHDELMGAAYFDVVVSDVLETGMPMDHQYGVVFFESAWSVKNGAKP
jgi:lipopolysaccharide transport system ATP-binding protein